MEPGCRVLLDAAALLPIAVLKLSPSFSEPVACGVSAGGFNPYFDLPVA